MKRQQKIQSLSISTVILIYFLGSITYALSTPNTANEHSILTFLVVARVMFSLLQYGLIIYLSRALLKATYNSLDIFSLTFLKYYAIFKFIFFSLLINEDLPTFQSWLNNKPVTIILSLSVLIFVIILNKISHERRI